MITKITSATNERIKLIKQLNTSKKERLEQGLFLVEGKRLLLDALKTGLAPRVILVVGREAAEAAEYEAFCQDILLISDNVANSLSDLKTPQGVFAVFPLPKMDNGFSGERLIMLSSLQDPGNIGTIIRTAEALGLDRVILSSDCPDIYSPKLLRATMGGVLRIAITVVENPVESITGLIRDGVKVLAATVSARAVPVERADTSGRACIVIGNEGQGLCEEIVAACSGEVIIPMSGRAQSLNAAMAAGILMWELQKQR